MEQSKLIKELEELTSKKIQLEGKDQEVEITTNLYYVKQELYDVAKDLAIQLDVPCLQSTEDLRSKVGANVLKKLKRYFQLYLKAGTKGTYDGEIFYGGGHDTSLNDSWYKVVSPLKENIEVALQDFESIKRGFRKKFPAMSSDTIAIRAAKEAAKQNKVKFQEILKTITPSRSLQGEKSWDKNGNLIKEEVTTATMAVPETGVVSPRMKQLAMYGYSIIEAIEKEKKMLKEGLVNPKATYDLLVNSFYHGRIPCRIKLTAKEVVVETGRDSPESLDHKIEDILDTIGVSYNDITFCAESSGDNVLESTRIAGGPKRY